MTWVNTNNLKIDVGGSASGTTLFANGLHMTGILISFTASYSGNSGPTCAEIKSQTHLQYSTDGGTNFSDMHWLTLAPDPRNPASSLSYTDNSSSMFYPTKNVKQGQCNDASKSLNSISELKLDYQVDDSKPICEVISDARETKGLPSFTDTSVTYYIIQGDRAHSDVIIRAKVGNGSAGAPSTSYSSDTIKLSFRMDTKYDKGDYVICDGDSFSSTAKEQNSTDGYNFSANFEQHNHHIAIDQKQHPGYYIQFANVWIKDKLLYVDSDEVYDSVWPGSPIFSWRTIEGMNCYSDQTNIKNILVLFPFESELSKFTISSNMLDYDQSGSHLVSVIAEIQFGGTQNAHFQEGQA